jgi:hypothetical protein
VRWTRDVGWGGVLAQIVPMQNRSDQLHVVYVKTPMGSHLNQDPGEGGGMGRMLKRRLYVDPLGNPQRNSGSFSATEVGSGAARVLLRRARIDCEQSEVETHVLVRNTCRSDSAKCRSSVASCLGFFLNWEGLCDLTRKRWPVAFKDNATPVMVKVSGIVLEGSGAFPSN